MIRTPVDILLQRSHAILLPFLVTPTILSLTHITPRLYLTLLRKQQNPQTGLDEMGSTLDVPLDGLRAFFGFQLRTLGVLNEFSIAMLHFADGTSIFLQKLDPAYHLLLSYPLLWTQLNGGGDAMEIDASGIERIILDHAFLSWLVLDFTHCLLKSSVRGENYSSTEGV